MAAIFTDVHRTVLSKKNFDVRMVMAEKKQLRYLNLIYTFRDPVLGQQRSSFFVKSCSESSIELLYIFDFRSEWLILDYCLRRVLSPDMPRNVPN